MIGGLKCQTIWVTGAIRSFNHRLTPIQYITAKDTNEKGPVTDQDKKSQFSNLPSESYPLSERCQIGCPSPLLGSSSAPKGDTA